MALSRVSPSRFFFFGTGIPAAIQIFNCAKQHTDVLFIDASRAYQEGKKQNRLREQDIEKIVKTCEEFPSWKWPEVGVEKYAQRATLEEI